MAKRWLTNSDYAITIDDRQLYEMYKDQRTLIKLENIVQEEISSYIIQRYDLGLEYSNTGTYSNTTQYYAADRVIIDYNDWSPTASYNLNDCVINNGIGYICNTASIGATTSFDTNLWTNLGTQYQIYSVPYPSPRFDDTLYYKVGDVVFWNGLTYSCMVATTDLTKTQAAQYLYQEYLPNMNVIPDDKIRNSNYAYWMPGGTVSYKVPIGTLPTNTTYWEDRDNRCSQLVNYAVDMVIYYMERAIAPRNINPVRQEMYKLAIEWLDDVAMGEYTINVPYKIPQQGSQFRAGGNTLDSYNW